MRQPASPEPSQAAAAVSDAMRRAYALLPTDPAAAARIFVELCKDWPKSAAPLMGLADVQQRLGAKTEAVQLLQIAHGLEPENFHTLNNLAVVKANAGDFEGSIPLLQQAHALEPFDARVCINLIQSLRKLHRHPEAFALASAWVRARPREQEAWQALTECLVAPRGGPMAIVAARRLAALRPNGRSLAVLSRALEANAEYPAAVAAAEMAIAAAPEDAEAHAAHTVALTSSGRLDEALRKIATIKRLNPERETRVLESRVLTLQEPCAAGWETYEHRFATTQLKLPKVEKPRWTGGDIAGKRIALWNEQGFGDKIQFARAAWEIVARGGEAIFYFAETLAPLFTRLPPGIRFTSNLRRDEFDIWAPLLSAPMALNDPWAGPNTPYILPPADRAPPAPLLAPAANFRVGLVWAGSPQHDHDDLRSCGLEALAPLLGEPGADFFALQNGPRTSEIADLHVEPFVTELAPHVRDWGDTAAAIAELDLVITVDTSVAHLAGAMGKPVWVLLQYAPDWRWGVTGATTRWYPSMRLYRQTHAKSWLDPIAAIRRDLIAAIAANPATRARAA